MVYPFNTNTIEQLSLDPKKKINGMIWFNTTDKVYKAYIDETLHVFLTDNSFITQIDELVNLVFKNNQFAIDFDTASTVIVKHNKGSRFFNYQLTEAETADTILTSLSIVDENEVRIDFVDPISGTLFMHFA